MAGTSACHGRASNQRSILQHITVLPQPLLERILLSGTSVKDKKALRQTCKLFQKVLNDSLVCFNLDFELEEERRCLEQFLKRMADMDRIRAVTCGSRHRARRNTEVTLTSCQSMIVLFSYLPAHTSTVVLLSYALDSIDLRQLSKLPCLTSLYLGHGITVTGMEHISGLTRLQCCQSVGSLAHLAPTLKHLAVWHYEQVQDMNQLTNLESLRLPNTPWNFFQANGDLPLKCLYLADSHDVCRCLHTWKSAPTTLTRLTMLGVAETQPGALPASITQLQLLYASWKDAKRASIMLPGIKRLDLHVCENAYKGWETCFEYLGSFASLQFLGLLVHDAMYDTHDPYEKVPWERERILSVLPEVAKAIRRGVSVHFFANYEEFMGELHDLSKVKPRWITHS